MSRKICVVTGSRAEYGLLHRLIKGIADTPELTLQLIATGMHLSPEFGWTYREIESDGFSIDRKVEMLVSSDSSVGLTKSMGLGLIGFADAFDTLKPDILVVLGDRFEILATVSAALVARIPVAHIHGGETTEGVFDDAIRHAVTKMSHLHFTSTETYRNRVIQLGEDPSRVFHVGALGVENIHKTAFLGQKELEETLGFDLADPYLLVTYHPVTLQADADAGTFNDLLTCLDEIIEAGNPHTKIIFTKANADTGGRFINQLIDCYVNRHPNHAIAFESLGQHRYLSIMRLAAAVVGNSSSGIIEAPCFNIPAVNIGDRQKGRVRVPSVIDCPATQESIREALKKALSPGVVDSLQRMVNPYEKADTALTIQEVLTRVDLRPIAQKIFFDIRMPAGIVND